MRPERGTRKRARKRHVGHRRYHHGRCPVTGKRSFKTKAKAVKDLKQAQSEGSVRNAYQCEDCGEWHLTSSRPYRRSQP